MTQVRTEPGPVWRVELHRPEARNAVSAAVLEGLEEALAAAAADDRARVVVLTGAGSDFCAGADIEELGRAVGASEGRAYGERLERALRAIGDHPQPVLASIQGAALGAGCQIAVACDLAVAAADATLGIPSARLGVVIGYDNVERLVRSVGPKRAADLLLAGRTVSGEEAAGWGLVNEAVPPDALVERTRRVAERLAEGAPLSIRGSKRGIRAAQAQGDGRGAFDELAARAFASGDLAEGIRAFRERRTPRFRGS